MNETLIRNWNERIKTEDVVFHLGDFCFKDRTNKEGYLTKAIDWEKKLNGKIILIKGNHDNNNSVKSIITNLEIYFEGRKKFLTHKPKNTNLLYSLNLVGHIHEKATFGKICNALWINVGVDVWGFKPINIQEIFRFEANVLREEKRINKEEQQKWNQQ